LDAVQQAEYKAQNYARNLRLKYEKEDAVDSAPGVSVVTAAAPLLPHVFPATANTARPSTCPKVGQSMGNGSVGQSCRK